MCSPLPFAKRECSATLRTGAPCTCWQAKYLEAGFADLAVKQNPRKRAELLRYIETMDVDTVGAGHECGVPKAAGQPPASELPAILSVATKEHVSTGLGLIEIAAICSRRGRTQRMTGRLLWSVSCTFCR